MGHIKLIMGHTHSSNKKSIPSISFSEPEHEEIESPHSKSVNNDGGGGGGGSGRSSPMLINSSNSVSSNSSAITLIKYQSLLGLSEEAAKLFIVANEVYWNIDNRIHLIQVVERDGLYVNELVDCDIAFINRARVIIRHGVISEIISFGCPWLVDK